MNDFEVGVVCGQCDTFATDGTAACTACGRDLAVTPRARTMPPSAAPMPEIPSLVIEGATATSVLTAVSSPPPRAEESRVSIPPLAPPTPEPAAVAPRPKSGSGRYGLVKPEIDADQPLAKSTGDGRRDGRTSRPVPAGLVPAESPYARLSLEELMEQARHYVCKACSTSVPATHKFCGRCGEAVPPEILNARTMFFGDMQSPTAKLVLIRGEGMEGLSFHLKAEQHVVGRSGQLVFPDDPFVSPRHANFFYRDGKLVVRDEGSLNGVYVRFKGSQEIVPGDQWLAGEQVFRLDLAPRIVDGAEADGTLFYSSPKRSSGFRVVQLLRGGAPGHTICARGDSLQIGREGNDMNFLTDSFLSGSHCRVEETGGKFVLTDLGSRNGTYLRLRAERELAHGDYVFIGRKLLRVEMNTN